jgi:hypothetical protein
VAEFVVPKPDSIFHQEYAAIDSAYRPHWWIATSMTTERPIVARWAMTSVSEPRFVLAFPDSGLAVRVRGR